jgi:hypothetical protein
VALQPWAEWAATWRENEPGKLASDPSGEVKFRKEKENRAGWLGCAQGREAEPDFAGVEFLARGQQKNEKGFLFFKYFLNFKPIWIQIKFTVSMTSTRTIKYKSTSPPIEKYSSAWNATNIIIYLL